MSRKKTILTAMPHRVKELARVQKVCDKHGPYDKVCRECRLAYHREYHRKRKDPFA